MLRRARAVGRGRAVWTREDSVELDRQMCDMNSTITGHRKPNIGHSPPGVIANTERPRPTKGRTPRWVGSVWPENGCTDRRTDRQDVNSSSFSPPCASSSTTHSRDTQQLSFCLTGPAREEGEGRRVWVDRPLHEAARAEGSAD